MNCHEVVISRSFLFALSDVDGFVCVKGRRAMGLLGTEGVEVMEIAFVDRYHEGANVDDTSGNIAHA